jgi:Uma2 family endonuclease
LSALPSSLVIHVRTHGLELEVRGEPRNRYPDLTIIREEHTQQLQQPNIIRLSMAPPLLVVEIVSSSDVQRDRDYIAKRSQYQDRSIPEYWIVDPNTKMITTLELQDGSYAEVGVFRDNQRLISPTFTTLDLTARQVLEAGN